MGAWREHKKHTRAWEAQHSDIKKGFQLAQDFMIYMRDPQIRFATLRVSYTMWRNAVLPAPATYSILT